MERQGNYRVGDYFIRISVSRMRFLFDLAKYPTYSSIYLLAFSTTDFFVRLNKR